MSLRSSLVAIALAGTCVSATSGPLPLAGAAAPAPIDRVVALADGRHIALHCGGQGAYTVLLEAGDGGRREHMAALFAALSKRYRVCDYDRRNVGRSSHAAVPRKAVDLSADLFEASRSVLIRRCPQIAMTAFFSTRIFLATNAPDAAPPT